MLQLERKLRRFPESSFTKCRVNESQRATLPHLRKSSFSYEATLRVILEDLDDLVRIPFCEQKRLLFWRRLAFRVQARLPDTLQKP